MAAPLVVLTFAISEELLRRDPFPNEILPTSLKRGGGASALRRSQNFVIQAEIDRIGEMEVWNVQDTQAATLYC